MSGEPSGDERVVAGRYRLLGPLGQGGMGIVWRARDEVLGREVAVKEVRAPAGLDEADVQRMYARLEREAWASARVTHRGVVTVYDVATDGGRPWIVMELVRGLSLAEVLEADGPLTPQRAAHIGEQVLSALRSAHEAGVLHRDVKPGNVLIANDGRVLLSDFGIARLEGSSAITMTGEVIGSPEYLAPEAALGTAPGPASDLWSLGVMLYAAVEGHTPFRQDTPVATLQAVVDRELPPPRHAGALTPVLEGLLRKDPALRISAPEAARMLRVVGAGGTVRAEGGPLSGPDSPTTTAHHGDGQGHGHGSGHGPAGGPGQTYGRHPGAGSGSGAGPDRDAGPYGAPALPPPAPGSGSGSGSGYGTASRPGYGPAADSPRTGRAGLVLTAGIVVLLLALAVLGWLLLKDRTGGAAGGSGATDGPGSSLSASPAGSAPTPSATPSPSPSPSGSATPDQKVTVSVHAVRDRYSGSCPPPEASAPAFTASLEVVRTPVVVEYRWTTRSGVSSAPDWQAVTFEAGGPTVRELSFTELSHRPGATLDDAVRVEVRRPGALASDWVNFSVRCAAQTPSGGASSPGTSGTSGSSGAPSPSSSPGPTP
ncbi:serine/threonine-protein kinase [Streptomyces sp. NPDC051555]|uniref:serine/threonine-protein kinase n=1 Tax=Streptomyces sp. NPDC051555 TaxID=3365657 RepID=UPI0037ACC263